MESDEAWSRARRRAAVQRVLGAVRGCSVELISFEEVRRLLHLNQKICLGLFEVELNKIKGSLGRYQDFTYSFLPKREFLRQRWQDVRSAGAEQALPPVLLYKVGQAYFVIDGNHRISIAMAESRKMIDAYVCEYISPRELNSGIDLDINFLKAEYGQFLKRTGLKPEQDILFSYPGRYMEVELLINSMGKSLEIERGENVSIEEASEIWYREIYLPITNEIRDSRVLEIFPGRTEADLFFWIWQREHEL
jgi:hypothetical protein